MAYGPASAKITFGEKARGCCERQLTLPVQQGNLTHYAKGGVDSERALELVVVAPLVAIGRRRTVR